MARKCREQLTLEGFTPDKLRAEPILEKPLSEEERQKIGRMYRENQRLIWKCQAEMARRFPSLGRDVINSCVDVGFLKAARVLSAEKGRLSTRFYVDARGECTHYIRAHGFGVSAPPKVRELGTQARKLMGYGLTGEQAARELRVSVADVKDALMATAGTFHEVNDWEQHECPRDQPWDAMEAS